MTASANYQPSSTGPKSHVYLQLGDIIRTEVHWEQQLTVTIMDPFTLLSPDTLHCEGCHAALGTRRLDGSVLIRHRGVSVVVRDGFVVCGCCQRSVSIAKQAGVALTASCLDFAPLVPVQ